MALLTLLDAFGYNVAWYEYYSERRGKKNVWVLDSAFLAELLNVLGCLLYVASAVLPMIDEIKYIHECNTMNFIAMMLFLIDAFCTRTHGMPICDGGREARARTRVDVRDPSAGRTCLK